MRLRQECGQLCEMQFILVEDIVRVRLEPGVDLPAGEPEGGVRPAQPLDDLLEQSIQVR